MISVYDKIYRGYHILIKSEWNDRDNYYMMLFDPNEQVMSSGIYDNLQTATEVATSRVDSKLAEEAYQNHLQSVAEAEEETVDVQFSFADTPPAVHGTKHEAAHSVKEEWYASRKAFGLAYISFSGMNGRTELTLMEERENEDGMDWRFHFLRLSHQLWR